MRTFFYSLNPDRCGEECRWQSCPRRYLARLQRSGSSLDIHTLWGDLQGFSPVCGAVPKSDDVVIVYVEDGGQLKDTVAKKEIFEGLRTILVVADTTGVNGDQYHLLAPRYITQADRNIDELGEVISKMQSAHS